MRVPEHGRAPVLGQVPDPGPAPGQTLVRVGGAALGHLDRTVAGGAFPVSPPLPYTPGVEGSGTVLTGGPHPPGTAVWLRGGGLGTTRDGTCAEVVSVPDEAVHPSPEGADPVLAACFFSPATSAIACVDDLGRLVAGERVAVTGAAGSVGALVVQLALAAGAGEVIGVVSRADRLAQVPAGARAVVAELGPDPIDLLVDTVGGPALADRLGRVRPGGRAVLVGYTAGASLHLDLPTFLARDVALLPLNAVRRAPQAFARADRLLTRLSRGELVLPVEVFALEDMADAWERLGSGQARGRVVLRMSEA